MLLGLRTVIYPVSDLAAATAWYSGILGTAPYFEQPFYVGYNVGGYELGLLPVGDEDAVISYWGVADADAALADLLSAGATQRSGVEDVGEGIRLATVVDPAGNVLGIIENPNFDLSPKES